jgi:hypothetical protein
MLNPLAPMVEKLSVSFWFIAFMAVIIPTNAIIPKAIMETVIPVRSLLLRTVRKDRESTSFVFMERRLTKVANLTES